MYGAEGSRGPSPFPLGLLAPLVLALVQPQPLCSRLAGILAAWRPLYGRSGAPLDAGGGGGVVPAETVLHWAHMQRPLHPKSCGTVKVLHTVSTGVSIDAGVSNARLAASLCIARLEGRSHAQGCLFAGGPPVPISWAWRLCRPTAGRGGGGLP